VFDYFGDVWPEGGLSRRRLGLLIPRNNPRVVVFIELSPRQCPHFTWRLSY